MLDFTVKLGDEVKATGLTDVQAGELVGELSRQNPGVAVSVYVTIDDQLMFCYSTTQHRDGSIDLAQA